MSERLVGLQSKWYLYGNDTVDAVGGVVLLSATGTILGVDQIHGQRTVKVQGGGRRGRGGSLRGPEVDRFSANKMHTIERVSEWVSERERLGFILYCMYGTVRVRYVSYCTCNPSTYREGDGKEQRQSGR